MDRLRSGNLSVIVRVHHGIGFELIEGHVSIEATFDDTLRSSAGVFPAHRYRINFNERFVWAADRTTVKSMRSTNGVVLVQCFRIPTVPVYRGESYVNDELYERQRVGQAVIRLKEFQVIGRDWDQEVAFKNYKLHCGTGNGNVVLRMSFFVKDATPASAAAAELKNPQARYQQLRDRAMTAAPTDRKLPVGTNRPQSVAEGMVNRQLDSKKATKREQSKRVTDLGTAYRGDRNETLDDNGNSMHNDKLICPLNRIDLCASNATTDNFIKTMEQLTMNMGEVLEKTFRQCETVTDYANRSGLNVNKITYKDRLRIGGGRGGLHKLDPSEKHRRGTKTASRDSLLMITAVASRESLLTVTTASALSEDVTTCARYNITMSNLRQRNDHNAKTSEIFANLVPCSSQTDYDMQRPVKLADELQKSVNHFVDCIHHTREKKGHTKTKYLKSITVLKKLDMETTKLIEKIKYIQQAN